jgi:hypothetical protein
VGKREEKELPFDLKAIPYMPVEGPELLARAPKMTKIIHFKGKGPLELYEKKINNGTYADDEKYTLFNAICIAVEYVNVVLEVSKVSTDCTPDSKRGKAIAKLTNIPGVTWITANLLFDIGVTNSEGLNGNTYDSNGNVTTVLPVEKTRELFFKIEETVVLDPFLAAQVWSSILSGVAYCTYQTGPPINPWP